MQNIRDIHGVAMKYTVDKYAACSEIIPTTS
jgi:hypothetical protein